jgi:hypothetical protein
MVTQSVLNSPVLPLLLQLETGGVRFRLHGEQVLVSPRGSLAAEHREVFRRHREAVKALVPILLDRAVQERRAEFRRQFEAAPAPTVPAFLFRDVPYTKAGASRVATPCANYGSVAAGAAPSPGGWSSRRQTTSTPATKYEFLGNLSSTSCVPRPFMLTRVRASERNLPVRTPRRSYDV